ncbi:hypothetical protein [Crenobacter cavernae]|uniref:Glycine zipper 2TM domain-containing protein n=1 Tax=Crenobacter cavernae TaxID=2290923 RepID=A0A345Y964_9NEIS|nr:hypothetical protein [Crenobacter cavernae]AXK40466.1 hypothetical protein DWG20_14070 [Crenobacter cavernae]RXZ42500.1 hypothetical protein EBB06_11370 [Crenobacter cavernae]
MNTLARTLLVGTIAAGTLLTGCSTSDSAQVYSKGQMRQAQTVEFGTVVSVNPVKMEGQGNELINFGGVALGGLAGSTIGHGRGSAAGAIVGAMAGGLATGAAQRSIGTKNAFEVTVRLDRGQRMISIVQEADVALQNGQRVRVLSGNGNDRVLPM